MLREQMSSATAERVRGVWRPMLAAVGLVLALAGCESVLDVENPNNVLQEDLETPRSAPALVNGALSTTAEALSDVLVAHITMTDETDWVGSQNGAGELERGQLDDNSNSYMTTAFNELSTARWHADYTIDLLAGYDAEGELANRGHLGRAYFYSGINYTHIADVFEDFTFSDREVAGPPIGEENMHTVYDTAIARLDAAISIAQATDDADLELDATAMRARAKWARALWHKVHPKGQVNTAEPLVHDADANADAERVLELSEDTPDWMYRFEYSSSTIDNDVAGWVNSRREVVFGPEFARADESRLKICSPFNEDCPENGIEMLDPIDGIKDPALQGIIFEFIEGHEYPPLTVVSARELHLILAESALQQSGGTADADFVEHINAVRAVEDGLTPYDPGTHDIDPLELLKHERLVNLFIQDRRLADMYRFDEPADEWTEASEARTVPGSFFLIGHEETLSNCHLIADVSC